MNEIPVQGPYIRPVNNTTSGIMRDVVIALLPVGIVAILAYGLRAAEIMGTAVVTAVFTDWIFSAWLIRKKSVFKDWSAVVTALLFSFTISPMTPLYVVCCGAFSAILFGKILWGGLGKNRMNPALVGREIAAVLFASVMSSPDIWNTASAINLNAPMFFPAGRDPFFADYFSRLIYKTGGALGEYSIVVLALSGLWLILRRRISWQIPCAMLICFIIPFWFVNNGDDLLYSSGGLLLGAIFLATDMPTSPTSYWGKFYYGSMIGIVTFLLILGQVRYEYLSYGILILNGFSNQIDRVFKPVAWGNHIDWKEILDQFIRLSFSILTVTLAVIALSYYHLTGWAVGVGCLYIVFNYQTKYSSRITNPV